MIEPRNTLQIVLGTALLVSFIGAAVRADETANPMAALSEQIRRIATEAGPKILRIEVDTPVPAAAPPRVLVMTRRRVGTGFVVATGGFVLTTAETVQVRAHWVLPGAIGGIYRFHDVAKEATAIDHKGRRYVAHVVGTCSRSNLALLQVDKLDIPPVRLAGKHQLKIGSLIVAFSAPEIPGSRMTLGLICQTHLRTGRRKAEDLLCIALPAGGGSAGAPVFAADGSVVGMISDARPVWILRPPRTPGADLFGEPGHLGAVVAIPSTFLARSIPDLKTTGEVLYGYLGVKIGEKANGLVSVASVMADSPASRASLREGDRLLALDGEPIGRLHDFQRRIIHRRPGEQIALDVLRDGTQVKIRVVLGRRPKTEPAVAPAAPVAAEESIERIRQNLLRVPAWQREALEDRMRKHLLQMRSLLEKELAHLKRQINALQIDPATTRPAGSE